MQTYVDAGERGGLCVQDGIVLLDLRSWKLGLITYGRSPVVVFPEQGASAADATKPD